MGRKIKFRAWDAKENKMFDPSSISWKEGTMWCCNSHGENKLEYELANPNARLMQFIGLTDKNGKEIYEGDIFEYKQHKRYVLSDFNGQVVWMIDSACFGYMVNDTYTIPFTNHDELQEDLLNHLEVIGNIYENFERWQKLI